MDQFLGHFLSTLKAKVGISFEKKVWLHFGLLFTNSSGHPASTSHSTLQRFLENFEKDFFFIV
jgi:hypothetical protein